MPWIVIPIGLIVFLVLLYVMQNHSEQDHMTNIDALMFELEQFSATYLRTIESARQYIAPDSEKVEQIHFALGVRHQITKRWNKRLKNRNWMW